LYSNSKSAIYPCFRLYAFNSEEIKTNARRRENFLSWRLRRIWIELAISTKSRGAAFITNRYQLPWLAATRSRPLLCPLAAILPRPWRCSRLTRQSQRQFGPQRQDFCARSTTIDRAPPQDLV